MRERTTTAQVDLMRARQVAVRAAEAAGRLLRDGVRGAVEVRQKGSSGDVVTDLDLAAERLIVGQLRAAFPTHQVVAEEGGASGSADDSWTWLVDPLDGTNNVAIGLPAYVVGVALCADRRPVLSVVHEPEAQRTWSAVRGRGAWLGGMQAEPVRARPRPVTSAPVLAWTQGHGVARTDAAARALKFALESTARRVLQLWAPLLGWVMLARGDIDGIVGYQPEVVDLPAGVLLAAESGMVVRSLDGDEFDDRIGVPAADRGFVAGPPENIDRLVKLVAARQGIESGMRRLTQPEFAAPAW